MVFLTKPSEIYRDSFLQALAEFRAESYASARSVARRFSLQEVAEQFDTFVQYLRDQADPMKVERGWVPTSEFWLIDDAYIGGLSLFHSLDEDMLQVGHVGYEIRPTRRRQGYGRLILQLGVKQAKTLGLERILLTCDEKNIASRKIIESNEGVLENLVETKNRSERIYRYWIQI